MQRKSLQNKPPLEIKLTTAQVEEEEDLVEKEKEDVEVKEADESIGTPETKTANQKAKKSSPPR